MTNVTKMAYEIYKKEITKKEYFETWEDYKLKDLTEDLKKAIYEKYLVKKAVFQRDGFKCQNINCKSPEAPLTMHHVRFQKNGGKHTEKNCITLCSECHKGFHRAKISITFPDEDYLPKKMRGNTFVVDKKNEVNWKKVKKEMRQFRKSLRDQCGLKISWEQLMILLKFLEYDFEDD